jgi:hypothetical protein
LAVILAAAALAAGGAGGSVSAVKPTVWHVDTRVSCSQAATCEVLPQWMSRLRNTMDVASARDGTMYYRAELWAYGRGGPSRCDTTLFAKPFSGVCHVVDFGVGFIKPSVIPGPWKGKPDFWVRSETAAFGSGARLFPNPFPPYPIDTGNPAVPGTYANGDLSEPAPGNVVTSVVTKRGG